MKLPYDVALARQIILAKQTSELHMSTARRPKLVEIGTQMKLENPRTRIQIPVFELAKENTMKRTNWITSGKVELKTWM